MTEAAPAERDAADRRALRAGRVSRLLGGTALVSAVIAIASFVSSRSVHGADMGGVVEGLMLYAASLAFGALALLLGLIALSYWASSRG